MTIGKFASAMILLLVMTSTAATSTEDQNRTESMNIKMTIAGQIITATLEESHSARDFFAMLPLTLPLEDYASTEKIAYLPRKLTTQDAPKGIDPDAGDITYYAPWGNLAIFYRDFGYSTGLIKLGRIESGLTHLTTTPSASITIEAIE
ncbi:cyclophilin-like fold protein [Aeromonas salmonicida]|uniref:cyclophilin-like fold protein n=1 Tax=Aeromonas salmonicida TaxID=645 RepID=UPI001EDDA0A7|nr:cyclophilin-like fold protein [Aeromonas salmonicida]